MMQTLWKDAKAFFLTLVHFCMSQDHICLCGSVCHVEGRFLPDLDFFVYVFEFFNENNIFVFSVVRETSPSI